MKAQQVDFNTHKVDFVKGKTTLVIFRLTVRAPKEGG